MTNIVLWHVSVDLAFVKGTLPFSGGPIRQGKREVPTVFNRFQNKQKSDCTLESLLEAPIALFY